MKPELVLFDCDGVIVDSEPIAIDVLWADLQSFGLKMSREESYELFKGGTFRKAGEEAQRRGARIPSDWADSFYPRLYEVLGKGVPLIAGVIELMDKIENAGIPIGIVSNGAPEKMELTLKPHGLFERFQGRIFSAYTYGVSKPDPELVRIAARHFEIAPGKTAFVDDSPSGCKAGQAAGMLTIGFAADTPQKVLRPHCDHLVSRMDEIAPILGLE